MSSPRGNGSVHASRRAAVASRQPRKSLQRRLGLLLLIAWVSLAPSAVVADEEEATTSPVVLRHVADELYLHGKYPEAIHAYRAVITQTSPSGADFMAHQWHAWERLAQTYRRLGDRLGEALAYEPIHEAWIAGLIPGEMDEADPHLTRAGSDRRKGQVAMTAIAECTGGPVFEALRLAMSNTFPRDYPAHMSNITSGDPLAHAWHEAQDLRRRGEEGWRARMRDAYRLSVRYTENPHSARKDTAWVYRIRTRWYLGELTEAIEEAEAAWVFWTSADAREQATHFASVALRRREAMGTSLYWKARCLHELDRHLEAIATLDDWHGEYADLPSPYPQLGFDLLVQANLAADLPEAADAAWRSLIELHPQYKRLGQLCFLLAERHNQRRREIQDALRETIQELNRARQLLRSGEREKLRLSSLLCDLEAALGRWREVARWRGGEAGDAAQRRIGELLSRIRTTEASLSELASRVPATREAIEHRGAREAELKQAHFEPLIRAATYYLTWVQAVQESGGSIDPETFLCIGDMHWQLAHMRPEESPLWEIARAQYETYLALDEVRVRPATDPDVRRINERLGIIYVRLAQLK